MHQVPVDDSSQVHFQCTVVHVSFDTGARLEFEKLDCIHRAVYLAIHNEVRHPDFTIDSRLLAHHQGRRLFGNCSYVADDLTIDPQTAGKTHVTLDTRAYSDQTVDPVLRLARLLSKHRNSFPLRKACVLAGAGLAGTGLPYTCLYGSQLW